MRAYPVVVSLAAAAAFGITLLRPPTLIERFALASGEKKTEALRIYCRRVTALWTVWLFCNAGIAAWLALSDHDAAWALWTGLLSYIVSGTIFIGEWLWRRVASHPE
jgi:uncharacterized membrane protein